MCQIKWGRCPGTSTLQATPIWVQPFRSFDFAKLQQLLRRHSRWLGAHLSCNPEPAPKEQQGNEETDARIHRLLPWFNDEYGWFRCFFGGVECGWFTCFGGHPLVTLPLGDAIATFSRVGDCSGCYQQTLCFVFWRGKPKPVLGSPWPRGCPKMKVGAVQGTWNVRRTRNASHQHPTNCFFPCPKPKALSQKQLVGRAGRLRMSFSGIDPSWARQNKREWLPRSCQAALPPFQHRLHARGLGDSSRLYNMFQSNNA